jgi:Fic family protein
MDTKLENRISELENKLNILSQKNNVIEQNTILGDTERLKIKDSLFHSTKVTLVSGTATINNARFTANSVVSATPESISFSGAYPDSMSAYCAGGYCTIVSSSSVDTRVINVIILI